MPASQLSLRYSIEDAAGAGQKPSSISLGPGFKERNGQMGWKLGQAYICRLGQTEFGVCGLWTMMRRLLRGRTWQGFDLKKPKNARRYLIEASVCVCIILPPLSWITLQVWGCGADEGATKPTALEGLRGSGI